MADHIILTAFGTTTRAHAAYQHLHTRIAPQFPGAVIHWAYSSPTVRSISASGHRQLTSVRDTIASIDAGESIVVQSLHVLPGREFERVQKEVRETGERAAIGRPLLSDSADLPRLAGCLQPLIDNSSDSAILLLGHGTDHPCRFAYVELERLLRRRFGSKIFLSTLEFPSSPPETTVAGIADAGYQSTVIIPLLLVAGMHFYRDITGAHEASWKRLLSSRGIGLEIHDRGLAMLPGVADIFCDHIRSACASPPL